MGLQRLDGATLADRAYDAIREAIISGELAPAEKVTERGLAERLAVSATPVREALRRLEQDRLVERTGPRTVRVTDVDDQLSSEVIVAEGALRVVAARLAATNATDLQLRTMEATLDEADAELTRVRTLGRERSLTAADLTRLLELTRRFHAELNEGCNNPVLLRLLNMVDAFNLAARRRRVSNELDVDGGRSAEGRHREHRMIFDAVRVGDVDLVGDLMAHHTDSVRLHSPRRLERTRP